MYCNNCGQRLSEDAKHCPNCGVKIEYQVHEAERPKSEYENERGSEYNDVKPAGPAPQPEVPKFDGSDYTDYSRDPYKKTADYKATYKPAGGEKVPNKGDGYAVAGLILCIAGILTCCIPFLGLVLSILAVVFSAKGLKSEDRHTMAVIALVIGIVFLVINLVMALVFLFSVINAPAWNEVLEKYNWDINDFYPY